MTNQQSTTNASIDIVSMNYRYIAAWNEVNARISLRQNAVTLFVTLSGAVIGLLTWKVAVNVVLISALMPCFAIVCTLLYKKHDETIALLRCFLAECENYHCSKHEWASLLRYNSSDHYLGKAHGIRRLHDWTYLILTTLFNLLGGYVAYTSSEDHRTDGILIAIYVIAAIAPWFILYARLRTRQ